MTKQLAKPGDEIVKHYTQKRNELVYLACPYRSDSQTVKRQRVNMAERFELALRAGGFYVYNPLAASVAWRSYGDPPHLMRPNRVFEMELFVKGFDWGDEYWLAHGLDMLGRCDRLAVLCIDGWDRSAGVRGELEHAFVHDIPIDFYERWSDSYRTFTPEGWPWDFD